MNPHDIMHYGQQTMHQALDGLPDSTWNTDGVCGWWSVKNILAHLVVYERMLEDILTGFVDPTAARPTLAAIRKQGLETFNTEQVAARQQTSPLAVLRELDDVHARVLALVPRIAPETWRKVGTLPWYGDEYALDDYVVYACYGHKREHAAQINVYKDTFKT